MTHIASSTDIITIPKQEETDVGLPPIRQKSRLWWRIGEGLLVLAILVVAGLAHGIGMFNNPFFLGDEGIYMAQAWAVVKEGRFDPYTYTYGHAPVGWVQIAIWIMLVGGVHAFGTAIDTGRVLMLLFQIGSTLLLYGVARSISRNVIIATLTCLLFALSPYGIFMHRRILLDNIITFWILLSILLLLPRRLSLNHVWLSAVALGIAVLSKENAILLVPVLGYLVYYRADRSHRWFATIGWLTVVGSIVSMYILMAILKGELFPPGTLLGGNSDHVSLLGSATWQAARERDGGLFDLQSKFWTTVHTWTNAEPALMIGGIVFTLLSILLIKRHRLVGLMGLATLSLWLFLIRGSLVLDFYLAPELPFMALNVALVSGVIANEIRAGILHFNGLPRLSWQEVKTQLHPRHLLTHKRSTNHAQIAIPATDQQTTRVLHSIKTSPFKVIDERTMSTELLPIKANGLGTPQVTIRKRVSRWRTIFANLVFVVIHLGLTAGSVTGIQQAYHSPILGLQDDPQALWKPAESTVTQREAIRWIQTHIPQCSSLVIDPVMWTDLHDVPNGKGFKLAHNYWQVELDPAIKDKLFRNDWRNVDYIIATPGLAFDVRYYKLKIVEDALNHSTQIQSFQAPDWADWKISIFQVRKGVLKPGLGCSTLK